MSKLKALGIAAAATVAVQLLLTLTDSFWVLFLEGRRASNFFTDPMWLWGAAGFFVVLVLGLMFIPRPSAEAALGVGLVAGFLHAHLGLWMAGFWVLLFDSFSTTAMLYLLQPLITVGLAMLAFRLVRGPLKWKWLTSKRLGQIGEAKS